jgi:hypothetical protein
MECDIRNKTSSQLYALEGRTPYETTLGHTPDISSLTSFDFYDAVWYYNEVSQFPEPKKKLARWLGEAHNFGQAMCYWLLPESGKPIIHSTVQSIDREPLTDEVKNAIKEMDIQIAEGIGGINDVKYDLDDIPDGTLEDNDTLEYESIEADSSMPEADTWDAEAYDGRIRMKNY